MPLDPATLPILVVDDHRTMQAIIARRLRDLGFERIDTTGDPVTALTMLRRQRYGLVLSDWRMEPMDGIALLHTLRADPDYADVPFILITAEARPANVLEARRLGVDGYLIKPFDAAGLRAKLTAAIGPFEAVRRESLLRQSGRENNLLMVSPYPARLL